jgi:hypothetical protein
VFNLGVPCLLLRALTRLAVELHSTFLACPQSARLIFHEIKTVRSARARKPTAMENGLEEKKNPKMDLFLFSSSPVAMRDHSSCDDNVVLQFSVNGTECSLREGCRYLSNHFLLFCLWIACGVRHIAEYKTTPQTRQFTKTTGKNIPENVPYL